MRMAVGLLEGRARSALDADESESLSEKKRREAAFPTYLLEAAFDIDFATADTSRDDDRNRLLNSLLGNEAKPRAKPRAQPRAASAICA